MCGSDGITYRGSCQLEMESCKQQKNITIVKERGCTYDSSWKILYVISETLFATPQDILQWQTLMVLILVLISNLIMWFIFLKIFFFLSY